MCNQLNFFLSSPRANLKLVNHENVRVKAIEDPARARQGLLHRDLYELYSHEHGVFLRAEDGGCCYASSWPGTYLHLAHLIVENEADWGALYFCFEGTRYDVLDYIFDPEKQDEPSVIGQVCRMDRGLAMETTKRIPVEERRHRITFQQSLEKVRRDFLALVGCKVRVRLWRQSVVGVLEGYYPQFGYAELRCEGRLRQLVPEQVAEIVAIKAS